MRKTTQTDISSAMAVDVKGLMQLLSCGEQTAREIGEKSHSRIPSKGRRVLYSVDKVRNYLESNSY